MGHDDRHSPKGNPKHRGRMRGESLAKFKKLEIINQKQNMTEQDKKLEITIFLCIAKLFSEQSTILIGELRHQKKQKFNLAVASVDTFLKEFEGGLNDYNKETLQILTDSMHDGIANLRKEIKEAK